MKRIMIDFPERFETKRLLIRMPKYGDGQYIHPSLVHSLNELKPWMPFAQVEPPLEEVEEEARQAHIRFLKREELRMYIFLKETGQFIGSSGFHNIKWLIPSFEIGYWLDIRYCGQGYMSEAVEGLTQFAFEQLNAKRVEIRSDAKNVKSRAIPERLGYRLEGTFLNHSLSADGTQLTDTVIYAKTIPIDEVMNR